MMMTSSHDLQVIKNVPSFATLLHINPAHTCDVNSHLGMAMAIRSERRQSGLRAHATHNRLRQHDRSNAAFFHQDKSQSLHVPAACPSPPSRLQLADSQNLRQRSGGFVSSIEYSLVSR